MESNLFKYGRYKESLLEKLEKKSEHKEDQETSNRINNYRTINDYDGWSSFNYIGGETWKRVYSCCRNG